MPVMRLPKKLFLNGMKFRQQNQKTIVQPNAKRYLFINFKYLLINLLSFA